ncbi:NAD(P)/FAD-dependent oxidoreductase [Fundidesulfovibrio soli]|uniref:NAD(P)/FAD-dependent oxidoreductase n=1 Tax=Fundidesulfovibrio soli TaxID=2922716 RepID=UPI001FB00049|nr:NAD(P)/FAD-dependent oxidoreductase [Fundidesulfovibrio soli]
MENTQCLIIGAGPAGLSAGIYLARAGIRTLLIGCDPKVAGDYEIANYFGFEESISGRDLVDKGRRQAIGFGADLRCERVLGVHHGDFGGFKVKTDNNEYQADALILATGVSRSRPPIPGIADYEGKGVSYCVSCDGYFYKGRPVVVAGEGVFAANQALELLNYTKDVRVCTLGKKPTMDEEFLKRLQDAGIEIIEQGITAIGGSPAMDSLTLADGTVLKADGLFIALGEASSTDFAYTLGVTRVGNFIEVDREMKTNIPGVFAAGDCTGGFLQIAVAVGEGATAAKAASSWVKSLKK